MAFKLITPKELKAKLDENADIVLIDVREDWEVSKGQIPTSKHIAMNEIPDELDQIPKDKPVVFICRSGGRSEAVTQWVAAQGYENVINLVGGVKGWQTEVDPAFNANY